MPNLGCSHSCAVDHQPNSVLEACWGSRQPVRIRRYVVPCRVETLLHSRITTKHKLPFQLYIAGMRLKYRDLHERRSIGALRQSLPYGTCISASQLSTYSRDTTFEPTVHQVHSFWPRPRDLSGICDSWSCNFNQLPPFLTFQCKRAVTPELVVCPHDFG